MNLFDVLKFEEGYSATPYYCSEKFPTIGIGTKIGPKGAKLDRYTFSVSEAVAKLMLVEEVAEIKLKLSSHSWYADLDHDRQVIIESMCYQIGYSGVMKFKRMIAALERQDFLQASHEALDSRWAIQTPNRAERHADVLHGGLLKSTYKGLIE